MLLNEWQKDLEKLKAILELLSNENDLADITSKCQLLNKIGCLFNEISSLEHHIKRDNEKTLPWNHLEGLYNLSETIFTNKDELDSLLTELKTQLPNALQELIQGLQTRLDDHKNKQELIILSSVAEDLFSRLDAYTN